MPTGAAADLLDRDGVATTVGIEWEGNNTWSANNPSVVADMTANQDELLLDGYLDNSAAGDVSVSLSDIPFNTWDLFVYVGSDGNGRTGAVSLTVDPSVNTTQPDIWYSTNTGGGSFTGPADFVEATALTEESASPANFVRYANLRGDDVTIDIVRGSDNSGIHAIQIVQAIGLSEIEVDLRTGQVWVRGGDTIPIDLAGYEIRSEAGSLRPERLSGFADQGLDSIDGPIDADSTTGNSPGENWQEIFTGQGLISEGFLLGSSTFDVERRVGLGRIYDASLGEDSSLSFSYGLASGLSVNGLVEFFTSDASTGDYNGDGFVDAADYAEYRETLGQIGAGLSADGNGDGQIDAGDLVVWQQNLGRTVPTIPTASDGFSVPEPSALWLGLLASATLRLCRLSIRSR